MAAGGEFLRTRSVGIYLQVVLYLIVWSPGVVARSVCLATSAWVARRQRTVSFSVALLMQRVPRAFFT